MSFFGTWRHGLWSGLALMGRRKTTRALVIQAAAALQLGNRFGIKTDRLVDEDHIREFLVHLSKAVDTNVRASAFQGVLVVYLDDGSEELPSIVMAGEDVETTTKMARK